MIIIVVIKHDTPKAKYDWFNAWCEEFKECQNNRGQKRFCESCNPEECEISCNIYCLNIEMKEYRHFKIECLSCGSVWEESFTKLRMVKEVKDEVEKCEDCGNDLIRVSGIENRRNIKN